MPCGIAGLGSECGFPGTPAGDTTYDHFIPCGFPGTAVRLCVRPACSLIILDYSLSADSGGRRVVRLSQNPEGLNIGCPGATSV